MNCKLVGSFIKHLEVTLERGENFYAQKGAMIYMEEGIEWETQFTGNGIGSMIGAKLSGESVFLVHYYNHTPYPKKLVVGNQSGLIHFKLNGGEIICKKGSFVCSSKKVDISSKFSAGSFLGGSTALLQRISGDGVVFLETIADPVIVDLSHGQKIRVDENHFLALEGIPEHHINAKWSAQNWLSGEGLSLLTINGPGRVFLNP